MGIAMKAVPMRTYQLRSDFVVLQKVALLSLLGAGCGGATTETKSETDAAIATNHVQAPSSAAPSSASVATSAPPSAPSAELGDPMPRPPLCPARKPAKTRPFAVALDGKPMPVKSVVASPDDDYVEIHVTNYAFTCDELTKGFRATSRADDVEIELWLGPHLEPEGCLGWALRETSFLNSTSDAQDGGEPLPGAIADGSAGSHTSLDIARDLETMGEPARTAKLSGTLDAAGCGPLNGATPPVEASRGQKGASFVVAGQRLPVVGAAIVAGKYGRELVIASGEVKCIEGRGSISDKSFIASSRAPVSVTLDWPVAGDDASDGKLEGKWMGHGETSEKWKGGRLSATPTTPLAGARTMKIKLGGTTKMGAYTVALDGAISATVCP